MEAKADILQPCLDAASHYLSYRPRSELEVRIYLRKRGFDQPCIEMALSKLREQGLIDDIAFARFWKENRESFSPRSQAKLKQELRQKGIPLPIIAEVTGEVNDQTNAYKAAQKILGKLTASDYNTFRGKLGGFLRRRGFNYEVTKSTINRLWEDKNA